jgi:hypothetical protein
VTQYARGTGEVVVLAPNELKPREPERIRPIHQQIVALHSCGVSNKEIAEQLGCSESHVSVILHHPETQELREKLTTDFVAALMQNTRTRIEGAANEALTKVIDLMRHAKSEQIQQRSAFDILDRAGFKPREVHVNTNINLDREDAMLLSQALAETKMDLEDLDAASYREFEAESNDGGSGPAGQPNIYPTRDGD